MSSLKCLYVHDHKFKKKGGGYYSEGKITDEVFSRYITSSDILTVYSRTTESEVDESLTKILLENIFFSSVQGQSFKDVFSVFFLKNLRLALKEIRAADFIIVRLPSFLGIFILFINLFFKKIFFIELVGDPEEALLASKENKKKLFKILVKFFTFFNGFFVKKANGVIYVTESALQCRYPTSNLQSYASNVEISIVNTDLCFESYYIKEEYIKVGMMASFNNPYKGISDAIQAVSLLNQKNINIYFHILGSGTMKQEYLDKALELDLNEKIVFDGVLSTGAEVNQWLDSLDLYIQPSRTEGLPRALIEAMARSLPVVATNVGGIPELLSSRFLTKPNDPLQLAAKIKIFTDSQQLRFEQGVANHEKAKQYDSNILRKRRAKFWSQARKIVEQDLK